MQTIHLVVEKGLGAGRSLTISPEGARVGRSSRNDIVLEDPLLSRHHCRLFFKPGEGLWVADLGSANQTLLNDRPIQESRLRAGDAVLIGDTVLRVVNDGSSPSSPAPPPAIHPVNLGLDTEPIEPPAARRTGLLFLLVLAAVALAAIVWLPKLLPRLRRPAAIPAPLALPGRDALEIDYEKVEGTAASLFRYHLLLTKDRVLSVEIDDVVNNRHVRKEKTLEPDYVDSLARSVRDSGFFALAEDYQGIQPDVFDLWDMAVTYGRRFHRTRIANRVEPDDFRRIRETVEECGKNELGLWAIQFSADKLQEMAQASFLQGKRLHDEREIQPGNLAAAIRAYSEADWYLETVEPKPDYYREMLAAKGDAERELQERFNDQNFRAERAIRLRDWEQAASELRLLCEVIPDRSDRRNQEARKKLLDVEGHLGKKR